MTNYLVFFFFALCSTSAQAVTYDCTKATSDWLVEVNERIRVSMNTRQEASWAWASDITPAHEAEKLAKDEETAAVIKDVNAEGIACKHFECSVDDCTETERRQLKILGNIQTQILPPADFTKFLEHQTAMETAYGAKLPVTYHFESDETDSQGKKIIKDSYELEPELQKIMTTSRDYYELFMAWSGWREKSGKGMRKDFTEYVKLMNKAATEHKHLGFKDASEMWLYPYTMDASDFLKQLDDAWSTLKPLYKELHTYVKAKLKTKYGPEKFSKNGHIPSHLLGNMWSQAWGSIQDVVIPYPNAPATDISEKLKTKSARDIFNMVEDFFVKIGFPKMTDTFWSKSIIEKNPDVEMVCHASAWDFLSKKDTADNLKDYRIKQCTTPTPTQFQTAHHETGHIEYFMSYAKQELPFRQGANPGFHEAVGDLIALSVMTDSHLKDVGLLDVLPTETEESKINKLMIMALDKIAFLPSGYLFDKWRWQVFQGTTTEKTYNQDWWKLRCGLQGVSPPEGYNRTEEYFDPGAKYHIAANVPYIRYFVSYIIQFQFHQALCESTTPKPSALHLCDISVDKANVEAKLKPALELGASEPWPKVMKMITGSEKIDASAMLAYFKPLQTWLATQNAELKKQGLDSWTEECFPEPKISAPTSRGYHISAGKTATTFLLSSALLMILRNN